MLHLSSRFALSVIQHLHTRNEWLNLVEYLRKANSKRLPEVVPQEVLTAIEEFCLRVTEKVIQWPDTALAATSFFDTLIRRAGYDNSPSWQRWITDIVEKHLVREIESKGLLSRVALSLLNPPADVARVARFGPTAFLCVAHALDRGLKNPELFCAFCASLTVQEKHLLKPFKKRQLLSRIQNSIVHTCAQTDRSTQVKPPDSQQVPAKDSTGVQMSLF